MFKKYLTIFFFLTTYFKICAQIVWSYPPPTYPLTKYCPGKCFDIYDTIIDWQIDTSLFYRNVMVFMRNPIDIFNYTGDFVDTLYIPKSNFRFKYCFEDTGNYVMTTWYTRINSFGNEYGMHVFQNGYFSIKPCNPIADFYMSTDTACIGDCLKTIDSSQQNATHWQWTFEGSKSSFYSGKSPPDICYDSPGVYPIQLIASNKFGSDTAIKDILVTSCTDCIQIPNAFTPNSDGINDLLKIYSNCFLDEYKIQIYNRWSNLVFESTDINSTWNGKYKENDCEPDVYSYLVIYKNTLKKKIEYKRGNITLLR